MTQQPHKYQVSILRELLFKPQAKFSELKKLEIENYHFNFHLKQLIQNGYVEKTDNRYTLTKTGKEFANRIDTENLVFEKQAKIGVAIHAVRQKNGVEEYLIHKRLKEPFYGWYGSHTGKIKWGETPLKCAKREFYEETGLKGNFKLKGIVHYLHFHNDGSFLEDKYFFVFKVTEAKGKLVKKLEEGENIWMTGKYYNKLKNKFVSYSEQMQVLNSIKLVYIERVKYVDKY